MARRRACAAREERERDAAVTALLDRVEAASRERDRVSIGHLLDAVESGSFASLLLLAGLVILAPIVGDVPGVPTAMGLLITLAAVQMLLRRDHIWLPGWMERRSAEARKVRKAVGWLRPVGRFVDRWSRVRLTRFVGRVGGEVIAVACLFVGLLTPILEFVPFSANLAGMAVSAFGVALVARDGLVALFALASTAMAIAVVAMAVW